MEALPAHSWLRSGAHLLERRRLTFWPSRPMNRPAIVFGRPPRSEVNKSARAQNRFPKVHLNWSTPTPNEVAGHRPQRESVTSYEGNGPKAKVKLLIKWSMPSVPKGGPLLLSSTSRRRKEGGVYGALGGLPVAALPMAGPISSIRPVKHEELCRTTIWDGEQPRLDELMERRISSLARS
jgi:hypothetical protein